MLKKIGLGLLGLIVVILVAAAFQPSDYVISRQVTINAPTEKVFPYLSNQKLAEKWAPWFGMDPNLKMVYTGPDDAPGGKASWDTQGQLGTGSATISAVEPLKRVGIELEYTKPMEMRQHSDYLVEPQGNQTLVTWRVTGNNTFPGRVACLFMNIDKHVGGLFEQGLTKLKTIVESQGGSNG